MTEQQIIPTGGRTHVKLIKQAGVRISEGGILLPDIAENTQDCECTVLATSEGPGYELPQWVAERLTERHFKQNWKGDFIQKAYAEDTKKICAQPRAPRVEVGKRYLFDITLATQVPGTEDEFFVEESTIYAEIDENTPPLELISTASDSGGYRTI